MMQSRRSDPFETSRDICNAAENNSETAKTARRPRWVDAARRTDLDVLASYAPVDATGIQGGRPHAHAMLRSPEPCSMQRAGGVGAAREPGLRPPGRLLAVALMRAGGEATFVGIATDASKFGAWDPRRIVFDKGLRSACQTVAEMAPQGRQQAHLKEYQAFSEISEGLIAVALTCGHYPARAGYAAVQEALKGYRLLPGQGNAVATSTLNKCSDPRDADKITSLQFKVDETREIFLDAIEHALARGESLEGLWVKSEDLGMNAKQFYKTSRAVKRSFQCCKIM